MAQVDFDFDTERASAAWLTQILSRNGYLQGGAVAKVTQTRAAVDQGASATIYELVMEYSSGSTGARPDGCLMKVAKSGSVEAFEERAERYAAWLLLPQSQRYDMLLKEPLFYESVRAAASPLPLIPCLGSDVDAEQHNTCLLLADYSSTHHQPPWPIPPEHRHCENTVVALARLHAHWWNSPEFGRKPFSSVSAEQIDEIVGVYAGAYAQFSVTLGDRLSADRRAIYERVLQHLPQRLKTRILGSAQLTLAHGDAHHWNMLLPNVGDEVVIFDWQTWRVDVGAHDLAYLMGVLWYAEHRGRAERVLLQKYLSELNRLGIDYTWDELTADYQLCLARHLLTPVIFSSFVMPAVWWPQLDRVFCAFDDWRCLDLFA